MTSVILGKRIRKVRDFRELEQSDVVDKIETLKLTDNFIDETIRRGKLAVATLSRWENGQRSPSSGYVHLLARALDVNYEEEIYWLGLAGHLAPTPIPTKKQIASVLEVYYKEIQDELLPALIVDHRNNVWALNAAASVFVGGYEVAVALMREKMVNLFSLFFDSEIHLETDLTKIDDLRRQQIVLFLMTNLYRRHEPFWQSYPECWRNELTTTDYYQFESMWNEVCNQYTDSFEESSHFIQNIIGYTYVEFQISTGSPFKFKALAESPSYFSNNFFQVLHYVLVDEADRPTVEDFFKEFMGKDTRGLKQWELRDVGEILASFT